MHADCDMLKETSLWYFSGTTVIGQEENDFCLYRSVLTPEIPRDCFFLKASSPQEKPQYDEEKNWKQISHLMWRTFGGDFLIIHV